MKEITKKIIKYMYVEPVWDLWTTVKLISKHEQASQCIMLFPSQARMLVAIHVESLYTNIPVHYVVPITSKDESGQWCRVSIHQHPSALSRPSQARMLVASDVESLYTSIPVHWVTPITSRNASGQWCRVSIHQHPSAFGHSHHKQEC